MDNWVKKKNGRILSMHYLLFNCGILIMVYEIIPTWLGSISSPIHPKKQFFHCSFKMDWTTHNMTLLPWLWSPSLSLNNPLKGPYFQGGQGARRFPWSYGILWYSTHLKWCLRAMRDRSPRLHVFYFYSLCPRQLPAMSGLTNQWFKMFTHTVEGRNPKQAPGMSKAL